MIEIIPAIDIIGGQCVRLSQGDYSRKSVYSASPVEMASRFVDAGFRRIHMVDLDGAKSSAPRNLAVLEQVAAIPGAEVEWGGGLKSEESLRDAFRAGASYAVVGSLAARDPELMGEWIGGFGADRIVLGADVRNGIIAVNGWKENLELSIVDLIRKLSEYGLKQVISTEISRDGMFGGTDVALYSTLMELFPDIILTASGGIGSLDDIRELDALGVPRVIVGKALYESRLPLSALSDWCSDKRQETRDK